MTDLDLPTNFRALIRTSNFGLEWNTQIHVSPLSRFTQRNELDGPRWKAIYQTIPMKRATFAELQSILINAKGRVNRLKAFDPDAIAPRGSAGGTPLVMGASQTGDSLITDGWAALTNGLLLPGDLFSVNDELKMVTASVDSDSSTVATINFEPPLRASPANDDPIVTDTPKCLMILDADTFTWDADESGIYTASFSMTEAFG
jgi:hypothetical protein